MSITISLSTLKRVLYGLVAISAIAAASVSFALAQEDVTDEDINAEVVARIQFPIAELDGCADKQACKNYCNQDENRRACFAFAKKHGLMKEEKARKIEKQINALEQAGGGPGGCQSEKACHTYCSDVAHMKECIEFGKRYGIMESRELEEAEKVLRAVESGAKLPGNCRGKAECELYCSVAEHMEECLAFAEKAGFMDRRELEEARRILPLMKSGQTPGGCRSKDQCEAYCSEPERIDECIAFAEKAGLAKPEELEIMRKTGGRGPGGCRGKLECETYCNGPENAEACFEFAQEHGLIPPEELERIEKAGGVELLRRGGPGGCRGKVECESFCGKPENQETCLQFAAEKGLIAPEELEKIKAMGGPQAGMRRDFDDEEHGERGFDEQERFFNELEQARQEGDVEQVQKLERMLREYRGERPARDEFPGRGEPTEGFVPPPGFGEGAPPHRDEEFQVPPGFTPPGLDDRTPEMKARLLRERGFDEFNEGISDEQRFEAEEERARFQEREQLLEREQIQENVRVREEEFRQRAEEELRKHAESIPPPEGFGPPPSPRPAQTGQPSPTEGEGEFRDFPPQSSAPRGRGGLARALSFALTLILGH